MEQKERQDRPDIEVRILHLVSFSLILLSLLI